MTIVCLYFVVVALGVACWALNKHLDKQIEKQIMRDTQASMKRDGVSSVNIHTEGLDYDNIVKLAKLWAAAAKNEMTWQQVETELKKIGLQECLKITYK